ncbi:MAG: bifunctional diaminohydroxyphosphoribosylaminopyrimidine deaminase/5-amino-6-(5-phosphoribosylamino)uracil reductase RibD [Bacteroidales bacterium]|nr:bifunctional diaminohydroxyphosphoribosylaminopyrimidine deaminase/5-amino-6-(5-phosphoribosylamino)uracil reductase RibD [Bacteroidales bacterium]
MIIQKNNESKHCSFMQRAIDIASLGLGHVSPNPLVGCVIVHNGKIIGEGYHYCFGGAHAEIVALNSVKNKELLKNATMYVTLEPCSHYGKTPPCAETIISVGIPHVVISCLDPNPLVSGNGIKKMIESGIKVETGVLAEEYRFVNRRFFTFFEKKRPYIILKWAQTKDGFIDYERNCDIPEIHWISSTFNKTLVHKWRSEEMAILIGSNTVLNDNPQLTNRLWAGKNPVRIVFMFGKKLPLSAKVFSDEAKTIVFTDIITDCPNEKVEVIKLNTEKPFIEQVISHLYQMNILSVLVEGGLHTLQSFIDSNYWDEARVITGNSFFYKGIKAPAINRNVKYAEIIGENVLNVYYNW